MERRGTVTGPRFGHCFRENLVTACVTACVTGYAIGTTER